LASCIGFTVAHELNTHFRCRLIQRATDTFFDFHHLVTDIIAMLLQHYCRILMCISVLTAAAKMDSSVLAQEALSVRPRPSGAALPFQVRPVASGLEVIEFTGPGGELKPGDIISWVATPDSNDNGVQVTTERGLQKEAQGRKDAKDQIALWTTRNNAQPDWIFVHVGAGPGLTMKPDPPGNPATPGFRELPEKLGGISLLPGFTATDGPPGYHGEVWGRISGPEGMEIQYSIWPVREGKGPRTSGDFVSDAARLAEEQRQWFREQHIGSALVQIALSKQDRLMVSYPDMGVNMSVAVNGPQQLADALLIMLSIPNQNRHVAWAEAEQMIRLGDVKSVTQFHSLTVMIRMSSGLTYQTREPNIDAVFDVLKKCGKYDTVGIITE